MSKTKIVATLGPATQSHEMIVQLVNAGVDVFRLNSKHGELKWHEQMIGLIKAVSQELKTTLGILVDLQGPEIRIQTPNNEPFPVAIGEDILLTDRPVEYSKYIQVGLRSILESVKTDDTILVDDGLMVFQAVGIKDGYPVLRAQDNYTVANRKSLNLPGIEFDLPLLTDRDFTFIDLAAREKIAYLALSFVRSAKDVAGVRSETQKRGYTGGIISKIENSHAIKNLDEIIEVSDAVMVARGDLGVEVPMEQLAYLQEVIIQKCRKSSVPVITATQMLQSMVANPLPTRAEVTDVANAVLDGTDAIMLSAETASGMHPIKAVEVMRRVATYNEARNALKPLQLNPVLNQTEVMTHAVVDIIGLPRDFVIDSIVVFTETGRTIRNLSRYRMDVPVFAITPSDMVESQLTLSYGVAPVFVDFPAEQHTSVEEVVEYLGKKGIAQKGHRILFVHGNKWKVPGHTNTILIREVL